MNQFRENELYYLFRDASIYLQPSLTGDTLRSLRQGDSVRIFKIGDMATIEGMTAPWCEVVFKTGNALRKGYLWCGWLSHVALSLGDIVVVYCPVGNHTADSATIAAQVIRYHAVAGGVEFEIAQKLIEDGNLQVTRLNNKGLQGMTALFQFNFALRSKGTYTAVTQMMGWNGTGLVTFPQLNCFDAIGGGYLKESFVFPRQFQRVPGPLLIRREAAHGGAAHKGKKISMFECRYNPERSQYLRMPENMKKPAVGHK